MIIVLLFGDCLNVILMKSDYYHIVWLIIGELIAINDRFIVFSWAKRVGWWLTLVNDWAMTIQNDQ